MAYAIRTEGDAVILGDIAPAMMSDFDRPTVKITLDELFRRTLARRPNAIALVDPSDRTDFTDGAPRRSASYVSTSDHAAMPFTK